MKWINVIQCKSQKNKENKTTKKDGHKEQSDEAQGPCQKDLISLTLLHPKLLDAPQALQFVFTLE